MRRFWRHGYHATSVDDLVKATGASRHALYSSSGGKRDLYRQGFAIYRETVVTPAFAPVEQAGAGLAAIRRYFEAQIALAEREGLPGPGCLVANAMTETAPHDPEIAIEVAAHNRRLKAGFAQVLAHESTALSFEDVDALADFLLITAQGLWSMSRTVASGQPLRSHVNTVMALLEAKAI